MHPPPPSAPSRARFAATAWTSWPAALVDRLLRPLTLRNLGFRREDAGWRGAVAGRVVRVDVGTDVCMDVDARGETAGRLRVRLDDVAPGETEPRRITAWPAASGHTDAVAAVGDPHLDAVGWVDAHDPAVRAALDEEHRALLAALLTAGARVSGDAVELPPGLALRPGALAQALAQSGRLLARLAAPGLAPVDGLLERVRQDREPGVRLACMEALLDLAPGSAQARAAVRTWRHSRDPSLRVVSAKAAGPAGRGTLLALADPRRGPLAEPARAQALTALTPAAARAGGVARESGDREDELAHELGAIAARALTSCVGAPARLAACRLAGAAGAPVAIPALARALSGPEEEMALAAAAALGQIGGPQAEAALLHGLRADRLARREAALQALASCGGPRSLGPLLELASGGLWQGGRWRLGGRGAWRLRGHAAVVFWQVAHRLAAGASGRLSPAWGGEAPPGRGALSLAGEAAP